MSVTATNTSKVIVTGVTVTMPVDVALTLAMVLGRVGGRPGHSRRGHSQEIIAALRSAGIARDLAHSTQVLKGDLVFEDEKL